MNIPGPLEWFFWVLYQNVHCCGSLGGATVWLFTIWSGVFQGCPASGALFAASLNPFLLEFERSFVGLSRGVILACADDISG
eukprot:4358483-Pyramimonas_sp.AAC.1